MKKAFAVFLITLTVIMCACSGKTKWHDFSKVRVSDEKQAAFAFCAAKLEDDKFTVSVKATKNLQNSTFTVNAGNETCEKKISNMNIGDVETFEFSGKNKLTGTFEVVCVCGEDSQSFSYLKDSPQLSACNIELIVNEMTSEEKARLCVLNPDSRNDNLAGETSVITRLGIPAITMADGTSGLRLRRPTIAYPSIMTLAGSWDEALFSQVGKAEGEICKAYGIDILLSPGINIQKNVLNGRNFEYVSEDPLLAGYAGAAYVNGLQSTGVGASVKHYAANSQEQSRNTTSSDVTERALREIYLRAFENLLEKSNPYSIMTSYNAVNGKFMINNGDLVSTVLRNEFGFGGIVESDWGAAGNRNTMAANGSNIYCGLPKSEVKSTVKTIEKAINRGDITEADINNSVAQILGVIVKTNKFTENNSGQTDEISNREKVLAFNREAAAQSFVLLKNNAALPLKKGTVAVFGDGSYFTEIGGYGSACITVSEKVTIAEGIENNGRLNVDEDVKALYNKIEEKRETETRIEDTLANKAAENSDIAIFTITRETSEGEDHSDSAGDYILSESEFTALETVSKAFHTKKKKVVVIINTGNPIECESWKSMADAILFVGLGGQEIGNACADVISGDVNPSGKLAETWPKNFDSTPASDYFPGSFDSTKYYEDIYVGYRYYASFHVPVTYSFGYGLSYTTFEYSDFKTEKTDKGIRLSVKIKNTGKVPGREIVQFYVAIPNGDSEHPTMQLCGFAKTSTLGKGKSQTVSVMIGDFELKSYSEKRSEWFIEGGEYKFMVGSAASNIKFTNKISLDRKTVKTVTKIQGAEIDIISRIGGKKDNGSGQDLALGKPAFSNYSENEKTTAEKANDGNRITRWSAANCQSKTAWWYVDLEDSYELSKLKLIWEANSAKKFSVYASTDAENWTSVGDFDAGTAFIDFEEGTVARYVKIEIPKTSWVALYSVSVYECKGDRK